MTIKSNKILSLLNSILFLGAILFLWIFFKNNIKSITFTNLQFNGYYLSLSFLFIISAQYLQALSWHWITCETGCNLKKETAVFLRLKNEILKYIPGKITQVGSIIVDYGLFGVSKATVTLSVVLENFLSLFGGLLASVFLIYYYTASIWISLIILVLLFIVLEFCNKILINLFFKIYRKIKNSDLYEYQKKIHISRFLILYFIIWSLFGAGFLFLIKSLYALEKEHFLFVVSSFSASALIGFVLFIIPAGLGFREGGLVFFLREILPSSILLILVILSRLQIVVCDLISLVIGVMIKAIKIRK